ncbi:MAG: hypothetical protein KKB50_11715, partial [Planctomycetes bacterium]|nr:hypothetical protein [Planctomycetota bacterium]
MMTEDMAAALRGFGAYLVERDLVRPEKVGYHVAWVRRYLLSPAAGVGVSRTDRITAFVDALAR